MAVMNSEEVEWCEENIDVLRQMMEGNWRAVPVRPGPQMIAAMAAHRGRELLQWYAALAQVENPIAKPRKRKAGGKR